MSDVLCRVVLTLCGIFRLHHLLRREVLSIRCIVVMRSV
jgi:hypothetical protein